MLIRVRCASSESCVLEARECVSNAVVDAADMPEGECQIVHGSHTAHPPHQIEGAGVCGTQILPCVGCTLIVAVEYEFLPF